MSNQLAIRNNDIPLTDLGSILAKSGFFQDTKDAAQAIVKVLAGQELGFGPIASMTGFHIIKGRVSMSANLMAAAVKRSNRYNFRVIEITTTACEIAFFEGSQEIGRSRFTIDDAKKAQTQNLDKFPRNMLYARAMSNGVKWYCPDVTGGPVYTPEELGVPVNEDGEVLDGHVIEHTTKPAESQPVTIAPEVTPPAARPRFDFAMVEAAANLTTPKGTKMGDLTPDQLKTVVELDVYTPAQKSAATTLLLVVQGDDWQAWEKLANEAESLNLDVRVPHTGITWGELYKHMTETTALIEAAKQPA